MYMGTGELRAPSGESDAVQRYERLLERLSELAGGLARAPDLRSIYRLLCDFVHRSVPCDGMFVSLLDAERQERRCVYLWGDDGEEDASHLPPMPMNDSPHAQAVRTGEIVVTDDLQAALAGVRAYHFGFERDPRLPRSSLVVPMTVMGRVIGAMELQSLQPAAFKPEDATAVRMAAPLAGMAIENVRLLDDERRLRREAEDSERRKAAILESAFDAIITIDHLGRIIEFNPAAERMFGHRREHALGRAMEDLLVPPRLRKAHRAGMRRHQRGAGGRLAGGPAELPALRADGSEFPAEISIARVRRCEPAKYTAVVRDVTERRRAEEARESLQAQLRQSQKMQAVGTLAGGIAHDFNNLIAAILGNAQLACEDLAGQERPLRSVTEIRKAGHRARDLVQRILSFARPSPARRDVVAPSSVIEESARLMRMTLPPGVALDLACEPDVPAVMGDATQLGQVLLNLGTNAVHALGTKAGRIAIHAAGVALDASSARAFHGLAPGRYARISVIDDGCGMDEATMERVFEPFFTTKPAGQGTGLGLSMVHGIVADHGGAVTVRTVPGEGTRFDVYFPAAPAHAQPPIARAPAQAPAAGHGQRILYIDDDEALVDLFARMLSRGGYAVRGFTDAYRALELLRADPGAFDVVVTDYNMPALSGYHVARAVQEIRPGLPVVVATASITQAVRESASRAGILAVVSKAHAVEELSRVLRDLRPAPHAPHAPHPQENRSRDRAAP